MNGRDLSSLAAHLTQNKALGNAEARYRSAVSRAYYGAFHLVVDFLHQVGRAIDENHNGHEQAYRILFGTGISEAVEAARFLSVLRRDRIRADYRLSVPGFDEQNLAMERVELAETIRSLLDKCRQNPGFAATRKDK